MSNRTSKTYSGNARQGGFALIVGLVILVLLTLIMLTALRMASLEERMAGNLKNQNIAFQAAESALREAETLISSSASGLDLDGDGTDEGNPFHPMDLYTGPFQEVDNPVCVNGFCQRSKLVCVGDDCSMAEPNSTRIRDLVDDEVRTADLEIPGIQEPQYVIEVVDIPSAGNGSTDERRRFVTFRITARAWGEDPNSLVQLQSTYRAHIRSFVD
jgi:type IV pilus assembly protein PilX